MKLLSQKISSFTKKTRTLNMIYSSFQVLIHPRLSSYYSKFPAKTRKYRLYIKIINYLRISHTVENPIFPVQIWVVVDELPVRPCLRKSLFAVYPLRVRHWCPVVPTCNVDILEVPLQINQKKNANSTYS